ncbi:metallophosphatase [Zunongwangia sp.]|uniref:metallophosphatase n=1 Tax=Zunongwangia sp. TaxID=1965325 RepID=UPI003AA7B196
MNTITTRSSKKTYGLFSFKVTLLILAICSIANLQAQEVSQTFYFTGNTGTQQTPYTKKVLSAITKMSQNDSKATFVALGNITSREGFPADKKERKKAKKWLRESLMDPLADFNGRVIYTPGKNEWNKEGHENIDDMESFIQDNSKAEFWPNDGCVREIEDLDTDNVELLMIDSQWFLEDWDRHPYINNKCDIKSRKDFFVKFSDDMKDEQNKTVIVTIHHSILSNTRLSFFEKMGGFKKEDFYSDQRKELRGKLETLASMFPDVIFVSASDNNLQYLSDDGIPQIISGTASKHTRKSNPDKEEGQFGSKDHGFAKLTVYEDNTSTVTFYSVEENTPKELFTTQIRSKQTKMDEVSYHNLDTYPSTKKSSIYTEEETTKTGFYKFLWGDHYRDVYSTKIEAPVLNLDTLQGNPKAITEGGGHQSRSLRIKNNNGNEYTLRELRKSALRFIQSAIKNHYVEDYMRNTIAERIVQDFYTTAHPYAPFALNPIFDTLNILNAEPKIYYLPKQKELGKFNKGYGDKLYMLEAHAGDENKDFELFGKPDDIISTTDLLEDLKKSNEAYVSEDEFLKIRLMDILIGDWDRHYDQWRWAEHKQENGRKKYIPIRRDRDQAFPKYDGIIIALLKAGFTDFRPMQSYSSNFKNLKWLNSAGYPLDQTILKNLEWKEWKNQVEFIQNKLTDELIDNAFKTLPKAAQDETIEEIKTEMKARRDKLLTAARDYYEYLSSFQILVGTEDDDTFLITRKPNGITRIQIQKEDSTLSDYSYSKDLTKEIWLYGLDGEDKFKIVGNGNHPIKLKVLGGENNDTYDFENSRNAKVYDYKSKKNSIDDNARKWLVDSYDINMYNPGKRKYDENTFFPSIGFNPDAGFKVGLSDTYTRYGLANNPFESQHKFGINYYAATNGFEFSYSGEFAHIFYKWNFGIEARLTSPNYSINYFGNGNNSTYDDDAVDRDYNRIGIAEKKLAPSLIYRNGSGIKFSIKPSIESYDVKYNNDEATGEFFTEENDLFEEQWYAGGELDFQYKNKSGEISFIRRGMQFDLSSGYKRNIDEYDNEFAYLKPSISLDYPLHPSGLVVLATKIGSEMIFGDNYEFYHAATLGGNRSLRGFRNERFNGKTSFYQSTDLRVGITKFRTNFVPIRMGVTLGFDYGRVWTENDDSEKWHNNFGGSVFINGFNALSGNLGLYHSDEGNRVMFTLGFNF